MSGLKDIQPIGMGGYIAGFDSLDDALNDMRKMEDSANAQLFPQQRGIQNSTRDGWYINIRCPWNECMIFGEAWSLSTADKNELSCYSAEHGGKAYKVSDLSKEDQESYLWSCESLKEARQRGYIFGKAYSVIEPDGELGSTHVFDMWPISKEAFGEAKAQGWRPNLDRATSPTLRRELELIAAEVMARFKK